MADYINKKELLDEAYECKSNIQYTSPYQNEIDTMVSGMERIIDIIEDAFAEDVVPVVRCIDCKHLMFSDCYGECSKGYMGIVSPDDYCSYGKRKDDNG